MNKKLWIITVATIFGLGVFTAVMVGGVIFYVTAVEDDNSNKGDDNMILEISKDEPTTISTEKKAVVKNGKIIYTNAGSGSCPPVLEKAVYDHSSDTYILKVKEYHNQMCTMDLRGIKQIVSYPDGTPISESAAIEIL